MAPRKAKSPEPTLASTRTPRSTRKTSAAAGHTTSTPLLKANRDGRPSLPIEHVNDMLTKTSKVYPVKEQTLTLDHPEPSERIVIFRQKVPTPKGISGHIIRRTDTDAVSASSLFRSAFPYASNEAEAAEMKFVAARYDTVKAGRESEENGAGRLTGTWVPLDAAAELIAAYGLTRWANALLTYESENPIPVSPRLQNANGAAATGIILPSPEPEQHHNDSPAATRASKRTRVRSPPAAAAAAAPVPLPDVGAAIDLNTITAAVEEARVPESQPEVETVAVEQDVVAGDASGTRTETETVTVDIYGSAEVSPEKQIAEAKQLVEQLKAERALAEASGEVQAEPKKRTRDSLEQEEGEADAALPVSLARPRARSKRSWFGRSRASPEPASGDAAAQPSTGGTGRRLFAFAGLAVVGAATAAAPYIFG